MGEAKEDISKDVSGVITGVLGSSVCRFSSSVCVASTFSVSFSSAKGGVIIVIEESKEMGGGMGSDDLRTLYPGRGSKICMPVIK